MVLKLLDGLEMAGDKALRKSVYAVGGVIGVLRSSSCLMVSSHPERGLRGSSDGRGPADLGVLRVGRVGFRTVMGGEVVVMGDADGMIASCSRYPPT